ncbi:probable ferredoxin protein [Fulvimarina pelagi HTCC2506]|uniref:Probable ferredoxin protein n=1 Tax=Fulvimarina pelagi HTCC2506 TaxID=314231 RepID=Q0G2S6_9HYPH|nr:PDR/VanB family oxidoreductase [Fulvimarina pelagi]EAU42105.1 probable ferredoxin protein [Fulvimarina pelagi HTCC2506]
MAGESFLVRVTHADPVTTSVKRLRMQAIDGKTLPPASAGSHIILTLKTPNRLLKNAYSLLPSSLDGGTYEVAVLRTEDSRGGSTFVHDALSEGSELTISTPVNLFPINRRARHHVLVAGGIGITPIAAMAEELFRDNRSFELHYCIRNEPNGAFLKDLQARYGERVHLYHSDIGERFGVAKALPQQRIDTHLYVCGPEGMIGAVLNDASALGWLQENLHAERFLSPGGGDPFDVVLRRSDIEVTVGEHESLLEAIERVGVDAPHLCRGGACGQCRCSVVEKDGIIQHRDHYLTQEEREAGDAIMTCVSRLKGQRLELDL